MNAVETPLGLIALHLQMRAFHVLGTLSSQDFVEEIARRLKAQEDVEEVEELTISVLFDMALLHFQHNVYSKTCHIYLGDHYAFLLRPQFRMAPQLPNAFGAITRFHSRIDYFKLCSEFVKYNPMGVRKVRADY